MPPRSCSVAIRVHAVSRLADGVVHANRFEEMFWYSYLLLSAGCFLALVLFIEINNCQQLNLIKEQVFVGALCGSELPQEWELEEGEHVPGSALLSGQFAVGQRQALFFFPSSEIDLSI